jgi:hypothetical protein
MLFSLADWFVGSKSVKIWISERISFYTRKKVVMLNFLGNLSSSHGCWLTGGCLAGWLRTFNKLAHKPWGFR